MGRFFSIENAGLSIYNMCNLCTRGNSNFDGEGHHPKPSGPTLQEYTSLLQPLWIRCASGFHHPQQATQRATCKLTLTASCSSQPENKSENSCAELITAIKPGSGWEPFGHRRKRLSAIADGKKAPLYVRTSIQKGQVLVAMTRTGLMLIRVCTLVGAPSAFVSCCQKTAAAAVK